eukprot:454199-Pleurochrysis_carterae.AAC.1
MAGNPEETLLKKLKGSNNGCWVPICMDPTDAAKPNPTQHYPREYTARGGALGCIRSSFVNTDDKRADESDELPEGITSLGGVSSVLPPSTKPQGAQNTSANAVVTIAVLLVLATILGSFVHVLILYASEALLV